MITKSYDFEQGLQLLADLWWMSTRFVLAQRSPPLSPMGRSERRSPVELVLRKYFECVDAAGRMERPCQERWERSAVRDSGRVSSVVLDANSEEYKPVAVVADAGGVMMMGAVARIVVELLEVKRRPRQPCEITEEQAISERNVWWMKCMKASHSLASFTEAKESEREREKSLFVQWKRAREWGGGRE